jgi:hypothetical protein
VKESISAKHSTKSGKKPPGKIAMAFGYIVVFGIIIVVIVVIVSLLSGSSKKAKTVSIKSSPKTTVQAPTVPLATLNTQSVTILTPVLTDFEQQMSQGQSYAVESNAGDVSSDFHTWETAEQDKENVSNNTEQVDAYNKADNAYYNAHQTAPDALSNWDTDAGNLPGDITEWANAEEVVADDNVTGSSSLSTDQQTATTAMQTYQADLTKAKADLTQL